jgi:hypothetical protein
MTTVEDIEKAIERLAPREFDRLRAWFEDYQAARFDERIAHDAQAGKLDGLAEQAIADFRKGRARELWGILRARHSGTPIKSCRPRCVSWPTRIMNC